MARRIPAGVLAATAGLTLVLAACGSGGDTPAPSSGDTPSSGSSATSAPANGTATAPDSAPGAPAPGGGGGNAGGNGGGNADPVRWNDALCKGLGGSMRAMLTALKSSSPDHKPEARKAATLAYLGATESALDTARNDLRGLGRPAALRQDTHDELVGYLAKAVEVVRQKKPEIAALDLKDPRFEEKLQPFSAEELDPARLLTKFEEIRSAPGMEEAYRKAPECQRMIKDTEGAFGG